MYAATHRRADAKLLQIITSNATISRFFHQSFSYKGVYYSFELVPPRFKNQRLVPELHPSMDAWLAEKQQLEYTEVPYITGFFNKVLNASNSILDYYALLPECMHRPLNSLGLNPDAFLPRELTDEQVEQFKIDHNDWIMLLKKRMVLDLITM